MMDSKKFTRTIEDFICEHCGKEMKGNGYTNHCSSCLWSKHVDINPGDREESCGGTMKPIWTGKESEKLMILHKCARCGFERKKELLPEDDFDTFVKISVKS